MSLAVWEEPKVPMPKPSGHLVALVAASSPIQLGNKDEANRQRQLRQNWQLQSWTYRDSIPELRYALNFLANCAARMRIFVGAYAVGGESDVPIEIHNPDIAVPPEVINACENALKDLGNGRLELGNVMHSLSTNLSTTGEAFLLGLMDPETNQISYSIRSISEIVVYNERVMLREGPMTNNGQLGLVELPPGTLVERMWKPHPQFRVLADCAMRALVNTCEDILILRRTIRATGRSRLAGRGVLFVPTEIDVPSLDDDNQNPSADSFVGELTDAMITPIRNEGDASGVVPLVIQAQGESIDHIKHLTFESQFDTQSIQVRAELIGNLATGLDLPAEVIKGMMDANHWTAYQVSADTVRQHIEPHVIDELECLTGAFLRPYIATTDLPPGMLDEWLPRILFWYDPTELVTPPDLSGSAQTAYNMEIISAASARKYMGFTDDDAPGAEEIELRLISKTRNWPPNAIIELLHNLDPELAFPAITQQGMIPGLKATTALDPGGVEVPIVPTAPGAAPAPTTTTPANVPSPGLGGPPGAPQNQVVVGSAVDEKSITVRVLRAQLANKLGYDPYALEDTQIDLERERQEFTLRQIQEAQPFSIAEMIRAEFARFQAEMGLTAAAPAPAKFAPSAKTKRLNRKLVSIDADLRNRLQVAANGEVRAQLNKAGNRVRQKVNSNKAVRTKIAMTRNEHLMMKLGKEAVEAAGFNAADIMSSSWQTLEEQFRSWVGLAQRQAVATAAELAGIAEEDAHAASVVAMSEGVDRGWAVLKEAMDEIATHALYNPNPNVDVDEAIAALNPDTIVPIGVIRAALGVAGGSPLTDWKRVVLNTGADVPALTGQVPAGGVATGTTIANLLSNAGAMSTDYEWVHGPSEKPFEPHEALDGVEFASFTDPALANTTGFPDNEFFLPGDHAGCLCDAMPQWVSADDVQAARDAAGE